MTAKVSKITAREVLDSRGNPTIEVEIVLSDAARGRASVPSGASKGKNEAIELRDGDVDRYGGKGVLKAIANVDQHIAPLLLGKTLERQSELDSLLKAFDGSDHKHRLGANAILGVSLAAAKARAASNRIPIYRDISEGYPVIMPVPMMNVLNGGRHAINSTDFQEFMVIPAGFNRFSDALRAGVEVYHAIKDILHRRSHNTNLGDEGGFAPSLSSNQEAVELILDAVKAAGYIPGDQFLIGIDVAASEFFVPEKKFYNLESENRTVDRDALLDLYAQWLVDYPIISIEDGLFEEDCHGWIAMTQRFGDRVQVVGDDLFTTDSERINRGIDANLANAVLIKPNQIGTLSEAMDAISLAKRFGWNTILSHRSGETEDTIIADLAVGTSAGQIKIGAPARGERTSKYNRLLRIEEELGSNAGYAGPNIYSKYCH